MAELDPQEPLPNLPLVGVDGGQSQTRVQQAGSPTVYELPGISRLEGDLDVADCVATGQLEMYDSSQTYLRTGTFEPDEMIAFWESRAQATSEEGCYPFAWVVGEMSWLDRVRPERERVVRYESWANAFAARFPQAVLCLYDLRRLGSGVLLDLIKTHPRILLGGLVLENPHHLTDDEFTAAFA